jgi:hypothetical protein
VVRHIWTVVVTAAVVALGAVGTAAAASDHSHGPIDGIVPSRGQGPAHSSGGSRTFSKNLVFHGGGVLSGNTVYAIYWSPPNATPIQSTYTGLINRFYTDVAVDTGKDLQSNVYYADTQYGAGIYGSSAVTPNSLTNASTFGGYFVDNSQIPSAYTCKDNATSICVNDAGVVNEINTDLGSSSGWMGPKGQAITTPAAGANSIFFVFTAQGVGSCFGSSCSFTQWCAYHSNSGPLLYANMPFADTVPSACDAGYHPNSSLDPYADATINVASHEHNETITDPFGTAWFDNSGNEIGDKCAWTFGSVGPNQANQTINSHPYILQREWSNYNNHGCVLSGV